MEKSLIHFEYSVKEFRSALNGLLSSDEDLSNTYLSYKQQNMKPRPIQDHSEVEFLLETYAKKGTLLCLYTLTPTSKPQWKN
jgi:hypothetical protein